MRFTRLLTTLTLGSAFALAAATSTQAAGQGQVDGAVATSLKTIQRDADAIAAGHYSGKALQAPAHGNRCGVVQSRPGADEERQRAGRNADG